MDSRTELVEATKTWTDLANEIFKHHFTPPQVLWDVRGAVAGKAWYSRWRVNYNLELYERNKDHFINNTVPHELAHLIARTLYPGCTAHGHEWKSVMHRLGVDSSRCHSYDTNGLVNRRARPYVYKCDCREHKLTHTLHRRIKMGQARKCNCCGAIVVFSHMEQGNG